jgi:hypothetical protein
MTWNYGDQIVIRSLTLGKLSQVTTATVVEDSPDLIAFYIAIDSPTKITVNLDGTPIPRSLPYPERVGRPWTLIDGTWSGNAVLWLTKPDLHYAIGVFWRGPERQVGGQYCTIQEPLRRHPLGFDVIDHVLDVLFWPDGTWQWKDEEEFEDAQNVGHFTPEEAANVRDAGEMAIAAWERKAWPFDHDWSTWEPDSSWPIPTIPANWDQMF